MYDLVINYNSLTSAPKIKYMIKSDESKEKGKKILYFKILWFTKNLL